MVVVVVVVVGTIYDVVMCHGATALYLREGPSETPSPCLRSPDFSS